MHREGWSQVTGPSCVQSSLWAYAPSHFCSHGAQPCVSPARSSSFEAHRGHTMLYSAGPSFFIGGGSLGHSSHTHPLLHPFHTKANQLSHTLHLYPQAGPGSSICELSQTAGCEPPSTLNCRNGDFLGLGDDRKRSFFSPATHVFSVHPGSCIAVTFQPGPRGQASLRHLGVRSPST